jgi:phosphate uptake regulator
MKRKIIKQGHNTLTVTLPIDWVKKLNLNAGDEIDVEENNGSLLINGKQSCDDKKIVLDISGLRVPMLWRFFQSIYREGYNEIRLQFDPDQKNYESAYNYYSSQFEYKRLGEKPSKKPALDMIHDLVYRFVGVEVIESGNGYCIVKEMGELSAKEFDNSLRRIFLLLLGLFDKVIVAMKQNDVGDIEICKTIHLMDTNVDRFIDYCCRINNKICDSSFQKNKPLMFSTLFLLELLGDEFKYVANHLARSKLKVSDVVPFAEKTKKHFENYYNLFYKFDKNGVIDFGEQDFKIYNEHFNWKESKNKDAQSITRHFMQISKFTFCLMELRIEMEY